MNLIYWLVLIVLLLAAYYVWNALYGLPSDLPPGPSGWTRLPLIGSLLSTRADLHVQFQEWAKIYGPIFHVQMATKLFIVLSDAKLVKEAFSRDDFAGRPHTNINDYYTEDLKYGVLFSQGPAWKENRRFSLTCLRDFGMGRFTMEAKIMEEVTVLLDILEQEDRHSGFDVHNHLGVSVSAIISSLVFGKHFTHDDPYFVRFLDCMNRLAKAITPDASNFIPGISLLPNSNFRKFKTHYNELKTDFYEEEIAEHKARLDTENPRDFIDVYLTKMIELRKAGKHTTFSGWRRQVSLLHTNHIHQVFAVKKHRMWQRIVWWMKLYVQEELDRVIGRSRLPCLNDQASLLYTQATLLEVFRRSSVVPLGVFHAAVKETTLAGYRIPEGAIIGPNLWGIHHDPALWQNPNEFQPERFLDSDGNLMKPDTLLPFSTGLRACIGELLARQEAFLFFASVLQKFNLVPPEGGPVPEDSGLLSLVLAPKPYKMRAIVR
ncbi:PREDICTED: cytochrome P450 18a1-like [Priapulus caudatus]|uniref:Cytochrome P450 18a1-like n=1 Tax=Priapulus caudatus TaxID=37621 RepID=A0ABM1EMS1_PRICU|nr:PREDICTED: cytochrome P450 18a1-like [Priapulus caudatus]